MHRLRGESGMMLTELLVAMVILIIVLVATFTQLDRLVVNNNATRTQNDAQDSARTQIDKLARELRNAGREVVAADTVNPLIVQRASAGDLVYDTVNPAANGTGANASSIQRVRWCLDTANSALYRQVSYSATAIPSTMPSSTCPGAWGSSTLAVDYVVNGATPAFTYDSATLASIESIGVALVIDEDPARRPTASTVSTDIALRNANLPPAAAFRGNALAYHAVVDASASTDPERQALSYAWYAGSTATGTPIGTGTTLDYPEPGAAPPPPYMITLKVTDPGGLTSTVTKAINP